MIPTRTLFAALSVLTGAVMLFWGSDSQAVNHAPESGPAHRTLIIFDGSSNDTEMIALGGTVYSEATNEIVIVPTMITKRNGEVSVDASPLKLTFSLWDISGTKEGPKKLGRYFLSRDKDDGHGFKFQIPEAFNGVTRLKVTAEVDQKDLSPPIIPVERPTLNSVFDFKPGFDVKSLPDVKKLAGQ
jgi:hypothetical protein